MNLQPAFKKTPQKNSLVHLFAYLYAVTLKLK